MRYWSRCWQQILSYVPLLPICDSAFSRNGGRRIRHRLAARSTRTADQLWHVRNTLAEEARRRKAEEAARQRAERERKAAAERRQYLTSLATREASVWQEVGTLLGTTVQKNYDEAVRLLRDLRDIATDRGDVALWETRVVDFRQRYARKSSLMERFAKAGFPA